jgi:hypothetical protein
MIMGLDNVVTPSMTAAMLILHQQETVTGIRAGYSYGIDVKN